MERIEDNSPLSEAKTTAVEELQTVLELVEELGHVVVVESSPLVGEIASRVTKAIEELKAGKQEGTLGPTQAAWSVIGKSENSGFKKEKKSRGSGTGEKKLARGRRSHPYKIKRRSSTVNDGYTWRKYGQKLIHGAKHPRSYYRCTYKNTKGCQARKQAQKAEDDDTSYHLVYVGHHTCRDAPEYHHQVSDGGDGESGHEQSTTGRGGSQSQMVRKEETVVGVPQAATPAKQSPSTPAVCAEPDVYSGTTRENPRESSEQTPPPPPPPPPPPVQASMPTDADVEWELGDVASGFISTEALLETLNFLQSDVIYQP